MFDNFRATLIFNFVYVYGPQCSITILTVLDVEQNIFRIPTFQCKSQRGWSFKTYGKIDFKNYSTSSIRAHIEQLMIQPHDTFSQVLSHIIGGKKRENEGERKEEDEEAVEEEDEE